MINLQVEPTNNKHEISFDKYDHDGPYHWNVLSHNIFKRNVIWKARYDNCMKFIQNELGEIKGKRILDMGCGDGILSFILNSAGAEVYGIDSSDLAISLAIKQHAQHNSNVNFGIADAYNTHFSDSFFDGVIASELIEHVQQPEKLL